MSGTCQREATTASHVTTVCGGIHKAIETLYEKYNGYVHIIIVTPLHRFFQKLDYPTYPQNSLDSNKLGFYLDDYVNAIKDVAKFYGIPVFDAMNIPGLNPNIQVLNEKYFSDGLHPNSAGHKLLGDALYKFCNTIFN